MLNEDRVRHMTKMAMFEKETGRKIQPALQYSKRDYISMRLSRGIISGTLIYMLAFGAIFILLFATVFTNMHVFIALLLLLVGVLLYIIFLYYYLHSIRRHAKKEYQVAAKDVKKLQKDLQLLEEMYDAEEESRVPGVKDEDFTGTSMMRAVAEAQEDLKEE